MYKTILIVIIGLLLLISCKPAKPIPTSTATSAQTSSTTHSETPSPMMQPTCLAGEGFYKKLVREAHTVVLCRVISSPLEMQRTEPVEGDEGVSFRDCVVEVEQYITNPQPFKCIGVRTFHFLVLQWVLETPAHSTPIINYVTLKEPGLEEGERVLLFLNKREIHRTHLQKDQYTIIEPFLGTYGLTFGKLKTKDSQAQFSVFGPIQYPWESLEQIIECIKKAKNIQ